MHQYIKYIAPNYGNAITFTYVENDTLYTTNGFTILRIPNYSEHHRQRILSAKNYKSQQFKEGLIYGFHKERGEPTTIPFDTHRYQNIIKIIRDYFANNDYTNLLIGNIKPIVSFIQGNKGKSWLKSLSSITIPMITNNGILIKTDDKVYLDSSFDWVNDVDSDVGMNIKLMPTDNWLCMESIKQRDGQTAYNKPYRLTYQDGIEAIVMSIPKHNCEQTEPIDIRQIIESYDSTT